MAKKSPKRKTTSNDVSPSQNVPISSSEKKITDQKQKHQGAFNKIITIAKVIIVWVLGTSLLSALVVHYIIPWDLLPSIIQQMVTENRAEEARQLSIHMQPLARILGIEETSAKLYVSQARAELALRMPGSAMTTLERVSAIDDPEYEALRKVALATACLDMAQKALTERDMPGYRKQIEKARSHVRRLDLPTACGSDIVRLLSDLYNNLGHFYAESGNDREARTYYQRALDAYGVLSDRSVAFILFEEYIETSNALAQLDLESEQDDRIIKKSIDRYKSALIVSDDLDLWQHRAFIRGNLTKAYLIMCQFAIRDKNEIDASEYLKQTKKMQAESVDWWSKCIKEAPNKAYKDRFEANLKKVENMAETIQLYEDKLK